VTVGTPTAPANASAIPADGAAIVTWTVPTSGNGSPPTGYVVSAFVGYFPVAQVTYASTATSETFAGLSDGTTYRFRVAANNVNGTGAPSSASGPVVVGAPTAPTNVTATAHVGSATVSWSAPSSNNGSAISAYVVTPYLAGVAQPPVTFMSTATTDTITGLTSGKSYRFVVSAENANGTGLTSALSNAITPG
jgi:large repetitive protein